MHLVHALCQQIPDAGTHMVRYREGADSNRRRRELVASAQAGGAGMERPRDASSSGTRSRFGLTATPPHGSDGRRPLVPGPRGTQVTPPV